VGNSRGARAAAPGWGRAVDSCGGRRGIGCGGALLVLSDANVRPRRPYSWKRKCVSTSLGIQHWERLSVVMWRQEAVHMDSCELGCTADFDVEGIGKSKKA